MTARNEPARPGIVFLVETTDVADNVRTDLQVFADFDDAEAWVINDVFDGFDVDGVDSPDGSSEYTAGGLPDQVTTITQVVVK